MNENEWTDEKRAEIHRRMAQAGALRDSESVRAFHDMGVIYMEQRESARRSIIAALDCIEAGELEAAIDILQAEKGSW